jgi:ribosomal protein S25|tara:strand:+ start:117 stop:320 length:204 start_codon:yes stop_codon:yes gene_type:complete
MVKKSKISKITAKKGAKKSKKGKKSKNTEQEDSGIILIDDDLSTDTEKELEERRAYLEEARSQDSMD